MPELISYVIIFGISMVFIVGMIYGLNSVKSDYQLSYSKSYSEAVCYGILSSLAELENSAYASGYVSIFLPDKIGENTYRVVFENRTVQISDTKGTFSYSCYAGYDISGQGSGGINKIMFSRNGTALDMRIER